MDSAIYYLFVVAIIHGASRELFLVHLYPGKSIYRYIIGRYIYYLSSYNLQVEPSLRPHPLSPERQVIFRTKGTAAAIT